MEIKLTIDGKIPSKKNRYQISRGRMYKPKDITDFEYSALMQLKSRYRDEPIASKVRVQMDFWLHRDPDVDNLCTTVLDILQNAEVIVNDKQVIAMLGKKYYLQKGDGEESCDITINYIK